MIGAARRTFINLKRRVSFQFISAPFLPHCYQRRDSQSGHFCEFVLGGISGSGRRHAHAHCRGLAGSDELFGRGRRVSNRACPGPGKGCGHNGAGCCSKQPRAQFSRFINVRKLCRAQCWHVAHPRPGCQAGHGERRALRTSFRSRAVTAVTGAPVTGALVLTRRVNGTHRLSIGMLVRCTRRQL